MAHHKDYFTSGAQEILQQAQLAAMRLQHSLVTPDHILLAMTRVPDTNAYYALQDVDIIEGKLARYLSVVHPASKDHPLRFDGVEFADESQNLFRFSLIDAKLRGEDYIAPGHLLVGMMRLQNTLIDDILKHFSLERKEVIKAAEYYLNHSVEVSKNRIPVLVEDDTDPTGCLNALRELLYEFIQRS